jgi:trimethylamine---corrinoid protein Co-methyltransferase
MTKGGKSAEQRANAVWKKWLEEYQQPALDPGVDEALREYMAKRKEAIHDEVSA